MRIAEYVWETGESHLLPFPESALRREIQELSKELDEIEARIAAMEAMVQGISVIYPSSAFSHQTMRLFRQAPRRKRGALTAACRSVLSRTFSPLTVSEICGRINEMGPDLLFGHRKPMASVMSVLRNMERHGDVVRGQENGKSVWQLSAATAEEVSEPCFRAQACFQ